MSNSYGIASRSFLRTLAIALACTLPILTGTALASEPNGIHPAFGDIDVRDPSRDLPVEFRSWYRNIGYQGGSCVQMSIGMAGCDQAVPAAQLLPFDSEYGKAILGGSNPQRVAGYCNSRQIRAWNITGRDTFAWMAWACRNGRDCAIGAGTNHFQTLVDHDVKLGRWYVCNNNSPTRIDEYDDNGFRSLHLASGPWVVVLDYPPRPAEPRYIKWW